MDQNFDTNATPQTRELIMAGGCFWCQDAIYRKTRGITAVESGYTGGYVDHPSYRQVCSGTTGHAEAVKVRFDPQVIDVGVVLDIFFASHNPTSLNRQGGDVGPQYRSAVFPRTAQDRQDFADAIDRHQQLWDAPIVTTIEPAGHWWPAEDEHQDFYHKHPAMGYCQVVINPKLSRIRKDYASWLID
ncbi:MULTISPECIES: peptide-methionine (S)-S-oxide reductase MsrA [Auritidibacter]|uniref:Peptide methionine sulfoxide reductase MsrA n=1 Tax=Auritidibacter ignavus TaxID=678932 RepID=A0AAJ6DDG0_9MICC|nr:MULTISPECIES: peptide-methionine (S)-S-oxide reductase MsrA [Auritidibacter]PXA79300.1 peptide-methionine (S)-S-oxide reductase [Auritidibacter sp. NML120779]AXR73337.1 peptide-methionine (S)-S-oxide reductase [Auritidibacter sp. NML130574]PXA76182.1 peptide-methionine (S)-S-oxide reductase [Auritidibacter sp. NML100628]PXA82092.1 peptide-methionine (S)-S-oxide reductase [Auritidibacter sp. NML120636]RMX24059.1 peptide-methionine (S)-S-oxide reductase [Auritidibacter ignavus]